MLHIHTCDMTHSITQGASTRTPRVLAAYTLCRIAENAVLLQTLQEECRIAAYTLCRIAENAVFLNTLEGECRIAAYTSGRMPYCFIHAVLYAVLHDILP